VGFYIGLKASNVAVSGGQVTVTSQSTATNDYYRRIDAPVTFSYTNASDFIMADSYGSLTIANSQTVSDGTSEYSNVLSGDQLNAVRGKTLRPFKPLSLADNADNTTAINGWNGGMATVTLAGRTLYKDGKWNTLCLPFDVKDSDYDPTSASYSNNRPGGYDQKNLTGSPLAGCTLKELDTESSYSGHKTGLADDGTLYLNFKDAYEIEAGKPYLIKWDSDGTNNLTASDLVFNYAIIDKSIINVTSMDEKVTFKGTYAKQTFTDVANNKTEDKSILFLGEDNTLFYPLASQGNDYTFNAFRAFFKLNTPTAVRVFNLSFGEENESTGIVEAVANSKLNTLNSTLSEWYTMDGRKLDGKPATKGLYINNGRKVVIK
jgi:hypothetical protein